MGAASRSDGQATIRCLVADDHPAIVDAVCRYLEGERGFEVVGRAFDGEEALRLIEADQPEVAVLDVRMPRLGGIEVAARLSGSTSVILYTAFAERAVVIEAL